MSMSRANLYPIRCNNLNIQNPHFQCKRCRGPKPVICGRFPMNPTLVNINLSSTGMGTGPVFSRVQIRLRCALTVFASFDTLAIGTAVTVTWVPGDNLQGGT